MLDSSVGWGRAVRSIRGEPKKIVHNATAAAKKGVGIIRLKQALHRARRCSHYKMQMETYAQTIVLLPQMYPPSGPVPHSLVLSHHSLVECSQRNQQHCPGQSTRLKWK